jgi:MoaA/NifB/PqqE/SkfB family radical SAM enzyme
MRKNTKAVKERTSEKCSSREFPQRVEIELAGACNLRCTYCPRKYLKRLDGFIDFSLCKRIIDELAGYPQTVLVLHRRGESLLHPDFIRICNYVQGKFNTVQLATNAVLLDDTKSKAIIDALHFISFSIDIPDVFSITRIPAKYDEVEAKILRFLDLNKKKILTQVSMVRTDDTPPDNPEIFKKIWEGKVDRVRIYEEHSADGNFGSLSKKRCKRAPCVMPFYEMLTAIYANNIKAY